MKSFGSIFGRLVGLELGPLRPALAFATASMALFVLSATDSRAATSTATMTVQLTVTASCTVNAATLDFGTTSFLASTINATTSLSVTCTNSTPYSVGLDNGANFGATRRMRQGANNFYVGYELYTDPGRTSAWTTATSSTACTTANSCALGIGDGLAQSITVYGRVPALGAAPAPGAYTDTVTITVTY